MKHKRIGDICFTITLYILQHSILFPLYRVDFTLRSNAFYEACKNEKVNGPVKKAYMSSVKKEFGPIAQLLNPMGMALLPVLSMFLFQFPMPGEIVIEIATLYFFILTIEGKPLLPKLVSPD